MTESQVKLKPCPFCGNEAEIERFGTHKVSTVYSCTYCGCSLETGEEWGHGTRWNTRSALLPTTRDTGDAEFTEGVMADGACILRDGVPVRIEEVLRLLNAPTTRDSLLDDMAKALADATKAENSNARRMRDAIVEARRQLAKGRALWNGPCHQCDAVLEQALSAFNDAGAINAALTRYKNEVSGTSQGGSND